MRKLRAGDIIINCELSIASPLPKQDVTLKSKSNKWRLADDAFTVDENVTMETPDNGAFCHDKTDII